MKKLLVATDNFLPRWDGISRFLIEVLPSLCEEFDVHIICPDNGRIEMDLQAKITKIPLSTWSFGDYTFPLLKSKTIKKAVGEADIVFTQSLGSIGSTALRHAAKLDDVKVVCYTHNVEWELVPLATGYGRMKWFLSGIVRMFTRYLYNKADLLLVPSTSIKESLDHFKIRTPKKVVLLGVNVDVFKPLKYLDEEKKQDVLQYRKELGLEDKFVVGQHGRLAREKNIVTLLRAFKWITKKHENAHLLVVADGLKSIGNMLRGQERITWIKQSDTVQRELQVMDCYVTTSLTETTSLSTLEAMSCGLPVVTTPVGFVKEYIKDGYNGLVFDFKNSFALQKKIDLLINNEELVKNMGVRARKKVERNFKWENTSKDLLHHLKHV